MGTGTEQGQVIPAADAGQPTPAVADTEPMSRWVPAKLQPRPGVFIGYLMLL